jgi:hypothetical protein
MPLSSFLSHSFLFASSLPTTQAKSGAAAAAAAAPFRCVHGVTRAANGCFVCPQCFNYDVC